MKKGCLLCSSARQGQEQETRQEEYEDKRKDECTDVRIVTRQESRGKTNVLETAGATNANAEIESTGN